MPKIVHYSFSTHEGKATGVPCRQATCAVCAITESSSGRKAGEPASCHCWLLAGQRVSRRHHSGATLYHTGACELKDEAANKKAELMPSLQERYFCLTNGQINGCVQTRHFACVHPVLHQLDKDLLCECLEANTRGAETFQILNNFIQSHGWSWSHCVEVCTDDAGQWWLLLGPWHKSEQGHSSVPESLYFSLACL